LKENAIEEIIKKNSDEIPLKIKSKIVSIYLDKKENKKSNMTKFRDIVKEKVIKVEKKVLKFYIILNLNLRLNR
jgi:hypothetical protein